MQPSYLPLNAKNVSSTIREYLIAAFYQVLYYKGVYPKESFTTVNSFNLSCFVSRHPGVVAYLEKLVDNCTGKIHSGEINTFLLVLYQESTEDVIERYVFDFSEFLALADGDQEREIRLFKDFTWETLYMQIRASLFTLITELKKDQEKVPVPLNFTVMLEAVRTLRMIDEPAWILCSSEEKDSKPSSTLEDPATKVIPLKEICTGPVRILSCVERVIRG
ncbi:hypothetical protein BABINDRAFT_162150 [Babjeviella inositovora NRRL Y-12698]|uniref:HORMA domain-containing protein n=1 Tax=Babjeviella inositovora NRRL Y-12698 TaxID=984486 RepID=A0A1E3QN74_9ASCO|nr:uncharacterized protein BABINDRAFT_162150 [Babjeviella inositovora NRRL Y-12698]ODQ79080.1 hypothetical protein BABINDRAFT_162150 [Babjeviella inositovora NRRL Y-12698]